jgi:hypothetical protein
MNQSEKKFITRTSPMVISDIESMLQPLPELSPGQYTLNVVPKHLTYKQYKLFWKYHGYFTSEFARAILNILPDHYHFISYDHLNNQLLLEVY